MADQTDAELQDAETIDGGFVPLVRTDLASVELDGEVVLSVPLRDDERGRG